MAESKLPAGARRNSWLIQLPQSLVLLIEDLTTRPSTDLYYYIGGWFRTAILPLSTDFHPAFNRSTVGWLDEVIIHTVGKVVPVPVVAVISSLVHLAAPAGENL